MPYTLNNVPLNSDEKKKLREELSSNGSIIIFVLIVNAIIFVLLSPIPPTIATFFDDSYRFTILMVCIALWFVFLIFTMVFFLKTNSESVALAKKDLALNYIEEITVKSNEVIRISHLSIGIPIFAYQIDLNKILFLQGHYLCEPSIYGLGDYNNFSELRYSVNTGSGKSAFPNTNFIIRKLPYSGQVMSIKLIGDEVEYGKVDALKPNFEFPDCLIIDGNISSINEALRKADEKATRDGSIWWKEVKKSKATLRTSSNFKRPWTLEDSKKNDGQVDKVFVWIMIPLLLIAGISFYFAEFHNPMVAPPTTKTVTDNSSIELPDVAICIVYDTSASMSDLLPGKESAIEPKYIIANRALVKVIDRLQEYSDNPSNGIERVVYTSLINFKGTPFPLSKLKSENLKQWLTRFNKPDGGTPLGDTIEIAGKTLKNSSALHKHILVLTDGDNTLGKEPKEVIPSIKSAKIEVHIIGFKVDDSVFANLKTQGVNVFSANDESELNLCLEKLLTQKILIEAEDKPIIKSPQK